jgi:sortase A
MDAPRPAGRRYVRHLGTLLIVVGLALLVWSFVVWRWSDPFTSLYTTWEQRRLDDQLAQLMRDRPQPPSPTSADGKSLPEVAVIRDEAGAFRTSAQPGTAIGRLLVPRLGLDMVMVEGTDTASLRKGPGRDERTFMPGEGKLVYIAGHRTTYSAPFAHIERLKPGDRVTVDMPYGTFAYAVSRHRIVDDQDLSVLRSGPGEEIVLQACHPRFFATERYVVWAEPIRPVRFHHRLYALPKGGTPAAQARS